MTTKLSQKHLIKGTREFELVDDAVEVQIKTPIKKEEFSVVLSVLDPEPVIRDSMLAFVSVVNREPLLEFFLDKPNAEEFNAFVDKVKAKAMSEDFGRSRAGGNTKNVNAAYVQETIDMLNTHMATDDLGPLMEALGALQANPESQGKLDTLVSIFNNLGPIQGAVLTYAPYISTLLSEDATDHAFWENQLRD